jgi:hypothetical protein
MPDGGSAAGVGTGVTGGDHVDIGLPKRLIEIEPGTLPVPEPAPILEPTVEPLPDPAPERAPQPAEER